MHRSHEVIAIDHCTIAHPDLPSVVGTQLDTSSTESIVSSTGQRMLVTDSPNLAHIADRADAVVATDGSARKGNRYLIERVRDRQFRVTGSGFWQVHPSAAATLVDAVTDVAAIRPGETVIDLYAGVGLFTAFAAAATGPAGSVTWVESNRAALADARHNLAEFDHVTFVGRRTEDALRAGAVGRAADVVILDPPRSGAKAAVGHICALNPDRIVYVACDPAALARDVASFAKRGYVLQSVRGFALFPMTHHVECVAMLTKSSAS